VDVQHATASRFIATQRDEYMAAWAAKQPALVHVTDRNGPHEIWLHTTGTDRPVVTPRDFPPGATQWFLAPALSADGGRMIYERFEIQGRQPPLDFDHLRRSTRAPHQRHGRRRVSGLLVSRWKLVRLRGHS
jgi:hypothetical protein